MKTLRALLLSLAVALATAPAAETSDPVGAFRIRLRGNSDTFVSLPLQRTPLTESALASRAGSALTLSADISTLPAEGAFLLIMSGALEGAVFPIASVSARTLTVDATGFDLSTLKTTAANGSALADFVAIVPYWTLDTLFPAGKGVHISPSASERQTEIHFFDDSVAGINHSAAAIYYYFVGSSSRSAGWYRVGGALTPVGQTRFPPLGYFIVRHRIAADSTLDLLGGVQMAGFRIPLRTITAGKDQDNIVGLPIAQPVTLSASRLVESGAFRISTSASTRNDELLVFDNAAIGINKSASAIYYYFAGNASRVAGWYQVGTTVLANDVLLRPGFGYVIRKRNSDTATQTVWDGLPNYLK